MAPVREEDVAFDGLIHTSFSPLSERLRLKHFLIGPFRLEILVDGGSKQANGDKQVQELHFSLDFRRAASMLIPEDSLDERRLGQKPGSQATRFGKVYYSRPRPLRIDPRTIGYKGKQKVHQSDQTWSCMQMTTDREPFDIIVWVIVADGNFYKHVVRFGPGSKIMRDFFDILMDLSGRSMERHENEAQLATLHGRC